VVEEVELCMEKRLDCELDGVKTVLLLAEEEVRGFDE
jgi:hypothetical protein